MSYFLMYCASQNFTFLQPYSYPNMITENNLGADVSFEIKN